jgi:excisionase family DNA binding protein
MSENQQIPQIKRTTLTSKEAAEYLGISYWLLLELVKRGKLPCTDLGNRKLYRVDSLNKWLDEQEVISMSHLPEETDNCSIEKNFGTLRKIF